MGDAPFATALGLETSASGMASFASGWGTSASGRYSVATGADAVASGLAASALGFMTKAESQAETVVGRYNALASSPSAGSWVDTDAVFRIGIGVLLLRFRTSDPTHGLVGIDRLVCRPKSMWHVT